MLAAAALTSAPAALSALLELGTSTLTCSVASASLAHDRMQPDLLISPMQHPCPHMRRPQSSCLTLILSWAVLTPTTQNPISPFSRLMAANRGEIAIRIFRAGTELGLRTVRLTGNTHANLNLFASGHVCDYSAVCFLSQLASCRCALQHKPCAPSQQDACLVEMS